MTAHARLVSRPLAAAAAVATVTAAIGVGAPFASAATEGAITSPFPAFVADHGHFRSFEAADPAVQLFPGDINDRGTIVGEYLAADRESGFRRDAGGQITRIDLPGAAGTQPDKINDRGEIVGDDSRTARFLPGDGSRGYLLSSGGTITRIIVPEARMTVPHGVNDRDQVTGLYVDAASKSHGFLWAHDRFTTIEVPGAKFTEPIAINNRGQIVGIYGDAAGATHGFSLTRGRYTTVDVPGATDTILYDINDSGQIAASSTVPTATDPFAGARGFVLRDGATGPLTEVRFPGAPRTLVTGINNRGSITGVYENPDAAATAQPLAP